MTAGLVTKCLGLPHFCLELGIPLYLITCFKSSMPQVKMWLDLQLLALLRQDDGANKIVRLQTMYYTVSKKPRHYYSCPYAKC